jgi:TetR/AcrR family transcriptional regulator
MKAIATRPSPAGSADKKSEKSEKTRQKLLEAGIELFSTYGYNSTTTRNLEIHAKVQRNLISYHFGGKEAFWKACVALLFDRFTDLLLPALSQARDIESGERIRFLIRQSVRAGAAHPEVMRIMFDEGRSDDWRLEWIVRRYTRNLYRNVCELLDDGQACGVLPELTYLQFYYLIVSSGAMFAMAPEYRMLSGEDPCDETNVDAQADAIAQLLTPSLSGRDM